MILIYIFNTDSVHLISMPNPLIVCVLRSDEVHNIQRLIIVSDKAFF